MKSLLQRIADLYAYLSLFSLWFIENTPGDHDLSHYAEEGLDIIEDVYKSMGGSPADLDARKAEFLASLPGFITSVEERKGQKPVIHVKKEKSPASPSKPFDVTGTVEFILDDKQSTALREKFACFFGECGPGFQAKPVRPGESMEQLHNKVTEGLNAWDKETRDRAVRHVTVGNYHDAVIGFFDAYHRVDKGETTPMEEDITRLSGVVRRQATSLKERYDEIARLERDLLEARSACNNNADKFKVESLDHVKTKSENNRLHQQISNSSVLIEKYLNNEMTQYNYTLKELSASHNDDDLRLGHVCSDAITAREECDQLRAALQAEQIAKGNTVDQLVEVKADRDNYQSIANRTADDFMLLNNKILLITNENRDLKHNNSVLESVRASCRQQEALTRRQQAIAEEEKSIRVEVAEANASLRAHNRELETAIIQRQTQISALQKQVGFYEADNRRVQANHRDLLLTLGEQTDEIKKLRRVAQCSADSALAWMDRAKDAESELETLKKKITHQDPK